MVVSVRRFCALVIVVVLVAAACSDEFPPAVGDAGGAGASTPDAGERDRSLAIARAAIPGTYDPVAAGEATPDGFRQSLERDDILPIYDPRFVGAGAVDWDGDSLVIGVDLEGEARAYPVGFLTRREMVIDNHRGIPTLVTW